MGEGFNKWWLLPFGILVASASVVFGIIVFGSPSIERSFPEQGASGTVTSCSGVAATNYACYQQRYQDMVHNFGSKAALDVLKEEYKKSEFVRFQCHQLTHVIGRAALDLYGDIPSSYAQGDGFCASGYYHGAMEAVAAKFGPDKVTEETNTICADLAERQRGSYYHFSCVHGLGHGLMAVQDNELFESLQTCDTLVDAWERESCYGGVFMENIIALDNPSHPSKYIKTDQPLYPCTDVDNKYKTECYKVQTSYTLRTQGNDFAKTFDLCATVEDDYRPACYDSLGRDASGQSLSDVDKTKSTCMLGKDYEAQSNCISGAVRDFIYYYTNDKQAKALCNSLDTDLRATCLQTAKEYYETAFQS